MKKGSWNLDLEFFEWLYKQTILFLEGGEDLTDLDREIIVYNKEEYTLGNLIELMLYKLETITNLRTKFGQEYEKLGNEIIDIWKLVWFFMWW